MEPKDNKLAKSALAVPERNANPAKGLDDWNNRLNENLEPESENDLDADEKAKSFSEKNGSGDQSDHTA